MKRLVLLHEWVALLLGGLTGAAVCALLAHAGIVSALAAAMGGRLPWYATRAAAISAYLLLSVSMLLGLTITAKGPNRPLKRAEVFALHEHCSWLAWGFVGLHVASLLIDTYQPFTFMDVLVPFLSPYHSFAVGLGVIGLYLIAVLVTSFYVRTLLGQRAWRTIHFSSFLLYVLATAHGVLAGSSSGSPWMLAIYVASGAGVVTMLAYRILNGRRAQDLRSAPEAPLHPPSGSILRRSPS